MNETDSSYMYRLLGAALNYIQCMKWTGCIQYIGGHYHPLFDELDDEPDFTYWDCYHSHKLEQGYAEVMDWIVNNTDSHC
jgi:hypothetical protein